MSLATPLHLDGNVLAGNMVIAIRTDQTVCFDLRVVDATMGGSRNVADAADEVRIFHIEVPIPGGVRMDSDGANLIVTTWPGPEWLDALCGRDLFVGPASGSVISLGSRWNILRFASMSREGWQRSLGCGSNRNASRSCQ